MQAAVIIYHKNIEIYDSRWIERCIDSIKNQTYTDFKVFEIDYGGTGKQIYEGSLFYNIEMKTHVDAHNYLLDRCFPVHDCAFNVNLDDFYFNDRFEKQIKYMNHYDVVSGNFIHIDSKDRIIKSVIFNDMDIRKELRKNHNIIGHPGVCYSKNFWLNCTRLKPEEIPYDDMKLWQRSIRNFRFLILNDFLFYYRIHENQICR